MKLMEKMRQKRLGNKGFTLIELIIVIAIMAVLLGLVGTQVIPYLERSREAKDLQIINSYSTAAVSAYSMNADDTGMPTSGTITIKMKDSSVTVSSGITIGDDAKAKLLSTIKELVGYTTIPGATTPGTLANAMVSKAGKTIDDVEIVIDIDGGIVTAEAKEATGASPSYASSSVFTTKVTTSIGPSTAD